MATTTQRADYMGRALVTPTSDARDYVGRATQVGDVDYMGRDLIAAPLYPPPEWSASTAYDVGDRVRLAGGQILQATVAGTSAATAPTAPGVGNTVVDGTVTWQQIA